MQITVDTSGLTSARARLLTDQQIRTAAALALRDAAAAGRDHLKGELAKPAGGPIEGGATRWTLGGTYASRFVQASDLSAEVGFASTQPHAAGRYLMPLLTGTRPRTKGLDLLVGSSRGRELLPSRSLARTPQGNLTRSAVRTVAQSWDRFTRPIRGGSLIGVFTRDDFLGRTSTVNREARLLGVIAPARPRRRTLDLPALVGPTVSREFALAVERRLAASLARVGLG